MKLIYLMLFAAALSFGACSSAPATDNTAAPHSPSNTTTGQRAVPEQPAANGGNISPTAGQPSVASNTAPDASAANADTASKGPAGQIDPVNGRRRIVDTPAMGPIPPPPVVPAPENSTMSSTMNKSGQFVETRTFKSDPQLLKVERTWQSPQKSTIKYWLRNGRTLSAPGDRIKDLATVSSNDLLANAGVSRPAAKRTDPNDPTGAKQ